MEVTMDIDKVVNNVVHEEISTSVLMSEGNKKIPETDIELLTHRISYDEKALKEECEAIQLDKRSPKEKHETMFSDEKLSKEDNEIIFNEKEILINGENECDKINASIMLDTKKTENAINNDVSTDIQNITQMTPKKNETIVHQYHTTTSESISDSLETLQRSPDIRIELECDISSDINIVRNKYADDQVAEVSIHNSKIQVNNPSPQKQEYGEKSSLSMIALEYGDTDSDVEEIQTNITNENQYTASQIQIENSQQYRTEKSSSCKEIDSEDDSSTSIDSDSSSSSSSSSSDSSSDSDSDDTANINKNNNKKKESEAKTVKKGKHIQNELDDLPPIEDLQISVPEVLCNPLGKIEKIVEQLVIVKPKPGEPTLNLDTVLFVNKGTKALGEIFDVFGSVNEPHYCVRFNDAKHIQDNDIKVGMEVYYCPNTSYTSLVFLHELTKIKACDAIDDDEPPAFSDDEEEQAYYEMLKQKNNKNCSDGKVSHKRPRQMSSCNTTTGWQSNHPWNRNRNVQFQRRNRKKQHNWSSTSHFNSAQAGSYSYNESWQQYPHQNNAYWQPVPPNPMSNGPYYQRASYNRPRLPQYGNYNSNNSTDANQYYQGAEYNFNNTQNQYPRMPFDASPSFNPAFPSVGINYSQFSNVSYSYMNTPSYPTCTQQPMPITNADAYWSSPSSVPPSSSDTTDATTVDPNSPTS